MNEKKAKLDRMTLLDDYHVEHVLLTLGYLVKRSDEEYTPGL